MTEKQTTYQTQGAGQDKTVLEVTLTVTLTNAPADVVEHVRDHLRGDCLAYSEFGNLLTLNDAFWSWFVEQRATPTGDFEDFEEWYEMGESWDVEFNFELKE